ncbi:MAG: flagellar hook-associated protein FlgL [Gaiellales bacterium]
MNTRVTQSMTARNVLADIQNAASRLDKTRQRLASGKELMRPSDDPFRASRALDYRSELAANVQHQRAIEDANGWQNATDTALSSIGDAVLRVRELAVAGANGSTSGADRAVIAREVGQLLDEIKADANAQYAGRYVFAGTATQTAPYSTADDLYHGDTGAVRREIGPGVQLDVNVVGSSAIGNGATGLIATLRNVVTHLQTNDLAALTADLAAIDTGHDAVVSARAEVGARVNRLETAGARLDELEEATRSLMSTNEDADMAKTYIDASTQQAVYQSALNVGAKIVQTSLLDFLR